MATDVYTVRMGLFDTKLYTPADLVSLYKADLKAAGFASNQLPAVIWPDTPVVVKANDPFQGATSLAINLPPFATLSQTRDNNVPYAQDPAKLAQAGKAFASIFTWNLCLPSPPPNTDGAALLREIFRRVRPEGILKLSPKVSTWESAPELQEGYPPRGVRPDCGKAPAPAPTPAGAGKGVEWGKVLATVLGLWVAKKGGMF